MKRLTKTIGEWFIKNFGSVFSILGFALTIYFGVFYVPAWLRESQNERLRNAQNEIQQSVKELIFSDSTINIIEITSLVHAKEITLKEKYPLSLFDILTKTEESFMEDRYLPLIRRRDLIQKIEILKMQIPKVNPPDILQQKEKTAWTWWLTLLSITVSITAVIFGIISNFAKYQSNKEKDEEIDNEIQDATATNDISLSAYEFEKQIEAVLKERLHLNYVKRENDREIDFEFEHNNQRYFVEAKYLSKSKIGLNTFYQLNNFLKNRKGEAWLIYNTDITSLVEKEIQKFNKSSNEVRIRTIHARNGQEFSDKLKNIIPT